MYDEKNKKKGVILTIKEFELLIDNLEDLSDYEYIQKYGNKKTKVFPLETVMSEIKKKR